MQLAMWTSNYCHSTIDQNLPLNLKEMDDSVPLSVLLLPHTVLARTAKEHSSFLKIGVILEHVMVVRVVVFSGHTIPQLVSMW
jgi:hypothetical protein